MLYSDIPFLWLSFFTIVLTRKAENRASVSPNVVLNSTVKYCFFQLGLVVILAQLEYKQRVKLVIWLCVFGATRLSDVDTLCCTPDFRPLRALQLVPVFIPQQWLNNTEKKTDSKNCLVVAKNTTAGTRSQKPQFQGGVLKTFAFYIFLINSFSCHLRSNLSQICRENIFPRGVCPWRI